MNLFRYEAVDRNGKIVRGVMKAQDEQQVVRNLAAMGYSARGIYATGSVAGKSSVSATMPRTASAQRVASASGVPVSVKPKVPVAQLGMLFRQLAVLVRSGVPLQQSLFDVERAISNRRLKRALSHIQECLQAGQPLSTAMAAHPDVFPAHVVAYVWCAELSGKLDILLGEIADDLEQEASDTRIGRIGWGIVKANLIFFIVSFPLYTIPGNLTSRVLSDNPIDSANGHSLLRALASDVLNAMIHKYVPLAVAIILIWILWGHMKRVPALRRLLDSLLLQVPMWGNLHRCRSIARFLHLLDELYAAGINPSRAWDAASVAPRNSEIAEKLRTARNNASASMGIADMIALSGVLKPEEVALIASGEKSGQVPEVLSRLSQAYDEKAKLQKSAARALSISLMSAFVIALTGAAIIVIVKTYMDPIAGFLGM